MPVPTYLPIGETIMSAWSRVRGSKGSIWAALLVTFLIILALGFFVAVINTTAPIIANIVKFIVEIIVMLLYMGVMYLGIKRAQDQPINFRLMFRSFESSILIKAIGVYILQILILIIPFVLIFFSAIFYQMYETSAMLFLSFILAIIGFFATVYLGVSMLLSMAFVLDKEMNPWSAITQSFAATKGNFWRLVAVLIIQWIIIAVSAIPFGLGLIWTLPLAYIIYGVIYKHLGLNIYNQVPNSNIVQKASP